MVGAETMAAMRGECFYSDAQQEMLPANVISWGIRGTMTAQDCAVLSPPYVHAPPPGFQAALSRTSGGSVLGHRASPGFQFVVGYMRGRTVEGELALPSPTD